MNIESKNFGAMLKASRQESGLSVERMSELCSVHRNTICNWERDARSMPYLAVIKYCNVLLACGKPGASRAALKELINEVCISNLSVS